MLKSLHPFASSHPPSLTNAPPGVQATREVISWPVGGGEKAKGRAEALRVCWPQNQGSRRPGGRFGHGKYKGGSRKCKPRAIRAVTQEGVTSYKWHKLTQHHTSPRADDARVKDGRRRLPWRVSLQKLLKGSCVWSLFCFPPQSWLWLPSETSLAVSCCCLSPHASLRGASLIPRRPLFSAHPHSTISWAQRPAPQTSPNYSNPHIFKPYCPLGVSSSSACDYSASHGLVLTLHPVLYWFVQSQRTLRYGMLSPKRS